MEHHSTIERLTHIGETPRAWLIVRRRWLNRLVIGALTLIMAVAVLDGADVLEAFGPDERVARASAGPWALDVEYPSVSRPALASVFRVTVRRDGGFSEPVRIGVTRHYLEAWDVNGVLPAPSAETAIGDWIVWEYDPPGGDVLTVTYEARLEPGLQTRRRGRVAVFEGDAPIAVTSFTTKVRP